MLASLLLKYPFVHLSVIWFDLASIPPLPKYNFFAQPANLRGQRARWYNHLVWRLLLLWQGSTTAFSIFTPILIFHSNSHFPQPRVISSWAEAFDCEPAQPWPTYMDGVTCNIIVFITLFVIITYILVLALHHRASWLGEKLHMPHPHRLHGRRRNCPLPCSLWPRLSIRTR